MQHLVKKPPSNAPKDIDTGDCQIRFCVDLRLTSAQADKAAPCGPGGDAELGKLADYRICFSADHTAKKASASPKKLDTGRKAPVFPNAGRRPALTGDREEASW